MANTLDIAPKEVPLLRVVAQRLITPLPSGADVVRHLTCVQGQDLPGALASVRLRTRRGGADVAEAMATGEVVRSWPMRGTLHLVPGEDLGWMLALTTDRLVAGAAARRASLGLDTSHLAHAEALARSALTGGRSLTRAELVALWDDAGLLTAPQRGYHLLGWLSQTGVTCFGPLDGAEQRIVLLDEWVSPRRLDRSAALAEWVGRYFRSHGPATRADVIRWTGLTAADVDEGLAGAAGLARAEIAGTTHYLDPRVPEELAALGAKARAALLLPGFDELVLGYADRSATVPPEFADRIVPGGNGMFRATVVDAGRVVGTWRYAGTGARRRVVAEPFTSLSIRAQRAVDRAR